MTAAERAVLQRALARSRRQRLQGGEGPEHVPRHAAPQTQSVRPQALTAKVGRPVANPATLTRPARRGGLYFAGAIEQTLRQRRHRRRHSREKAMTKVEVSIALKAPFAKRYDNYIGGEWRAPEAASISTTSRRSPASRSARSPAPTRTTSRPRSTPRTPPRTHGARTSPAERAQILNDRRPDGGESRDARARRDLGQRQADPRDDAPPTCRWPSIISAISPAAIRAQEGSISEIDHDTVAYHFHEPLGVVGQIIPWNFPLLMAVLEARARARRRQLRRAEARRTDAGLDHGVDRARRRPLAQGRAQHRQRLRPRGRQAARLRRTASPRSPSPARRRPAGSSCNTPRRT